jgi:hypothetical protein
MELDLVDSKGKTTFKKLADGSLLATSKPERNESYTLSFHTHHQRITGIRIEGLSDKSLPMAGPGRGPQGDFFLSEINLTAAPLSGKDKAKPVKLRAVAATSEPAGFTLKGTLDRDSKTGWSAGIGAGKDQAAAFETDGVTGFVGGSLLTLTLKFENNGYALGRLRVAFTTAPRPLNLDAEAAPQNLREFLLLMQNEQNQLTPRNKEPAVRWLHTLEPAVEKTYQLVDEHAKKAPKPALLDVFAASSRRTDKVYFLVRGEVERKKGVSQPGFLQVLMNAPDNDQHWLASKTVPAAEPRLALARWLTDSDNGAGGLLARVIINRLWQHHLGRGIVATSNDFGTQGEAPTHPELLDYLARQLIKGGWKLKPIHRLIMTSAVYMQGDKVAPANVPADPQNRLWWRRPARRLEAEAIRDALLAVSNTLDSSMYGPGSLDAANPRRSVYLKVKRSQMVPLMQMFDAPEPIQSIGERTTTTVPTQSLAFLNSPLVRKAAEKFSQRLRAKSPADAAAAIDEAYLIALSRRPTSSECARMLTFVQSQAESYGPTPAARNHALTDFCQVLLCLNEFVYID